MYLWILAAVAAYFIKGLCGFANTLVFTSILSFGVANANISPIDLLLGYPTNLILTWKNRRSLDPKVYLPLAALVLSGAVCLNMAKISLLFAQACGRQSRQGAVRRCCSGLGRGNVFAGVQQKASALL